MTEEIIIIDGVNVAGCKCYLFRDKEPTSDRTCGIGLTACKGKECYYKTIQRLEQEKAELKDYSQRMENQRENYYKEYLCLQQENEKLTKQNNLLLNQLVINDGEDVTVQISQRQFEEYNNLKQENEELKRKLSSTKCYLCGEGFLTPEGAELYDEKEKYRSALEEINRVIRLAHKTEDYLLGQDYTDLVDRVEKEINEVLNDKNNN